ncbi:hypothetical protein DE4585_02650 [Mycobacteroides salmoniphilum]|uniref:Uncharacterized protein n=1 Tax=Mycobacteroides salmoniphilum TaxID=404941 RepID=A0A4R8S0E2_9MYCO|nr:hypothetical protein DE4585_02650 [Mycobacteroides salmoniphilum]
MPAPRPPSYRNAQDAKTQAVLARTDAVRAIDPCSLIDLNAAARIGPILYVGTDSDPAECAIKYVIPEIPDPKPVFPSDKIDQPGLVDHIEVGTRAIDFTGGDQLDRPLRGDGCSSFVDTGLVYADGTYELLMYSLAISGGFAAPHISRCEDLHQVVESSRGLIKNPGLRSASNRLAPSKLLSLDPCAPLDVFGVGKDIEILSTVRPFSCEYRVRGDKEDDTRVGISFWNRQLDDLPDPLKYLDNPFKIRGLPAEFTTHEPYVGVIRCEVRAYIGLDKPSTGTDPLSTKSHWANTITVTGHDKNKKCAALIEIADEAVREYQQAK